MPTSQAARGPPPLCRNYLTKDPEPLRAERQMMTDRIVNIIAFVGATVLSERRLVHDLCAETLPHPEGAVS